MYIRNNREIKQNSIIRNRTAKTDYVTDKPVGRSTSSTSITFYHSPDKNMIKDRTFIAKASRSVMKHNSMASVPMTAKSRNTNPNVYRIWVTMKKAVKIGKDKLQVQKELGERARLSQ